MLKSGSSKYKTFNFYFYFPFCSVLLFFLLSKYPFMKICCCLFCVCVCVCCCYDYFMDSLLHDISIDRNQYLNHIKIPHISFIVFHLKLVSFDKGHFPNIYQIIPCFVVNEMKACV